MAEQKLFKRYPHRQLFSKEQIPPTLHSQLDVLLLELEKTRILCTNF